MQNILTVIGSPRKNGNTVFLSKRLREQLLEVDQPDTIFLNDADIHPCTDCRACKEGDLVCVVRDDMQRVYPRLEAADILIIGTPIYWYGPTAQSKLFIDRLRPYYGNKKLKEKKAALLLPAGSGEPDCDLTIEMFKRIFEALDIAYIGAVTAKAYDIGEAAHDKDALKAIDALAERITTSNP